MMLRTRFAVILGGAAVALAGVTLITARIVIIERGTDLDEQSARDTIGKGVRIVADEHDTLLRTATDWAAWDDAYIFMGDHNQRYVDVNLVDSTFQELRIDSIVYFDLRKNVFHAKTASDRDAEAPRPELLVSHVRKNVTALDLALQGERVAGFACAGDGLWMLAIAPVVKSNKEGPLRGALLMARWVGPRERNRLAGLVHESLRVTPAVEGIKGSSDFVKVVSANMLEARAFVRGLDGGGADMVVSMPRRSFAQGVAAMLYLAGWIAVSSAIVALLAFALLDRWVLQEVTESVETLRANVNAVASGDAERPRVWKRQANEMGDLADSINAMLDSLESSEMHLRASEARYRGLVEATPEAIVGVDAGARLVFANRAFLQWVGIERESLAVDRLLPDLIEGEAGAELGRRATGLLAGKSLELGAIRGVTAGVERWITAVLTGIASGESHGGYVLVCMNDVTSKTLAEREAEKRRAEAVQAQKLAGLGTLVAGVAHEVNNPNSIVSLNMNLVKRLIARHFSALRSDGTTPSGQRPADLDAMEREMNEAATEVLNASARISGLVSSLKRFAQPAGERMMDSVDINEAANRARDWLRHEVRKRHSNLETVLAPALPTVKGNAEQLQQVFMNLIQNGLHAYGAAGGTVCVATSFDREQGAVVATVRDDGVGIRPENIEHIMDPFFTTRRSEGGTGLGLSISASIVKAHGGSIRVESKVGKGTLVTVTLPAEKEKTHVS